MPPKPGRTALQDRYDRRRADVVVDAARIFAAKGYDQTSVPQLAEELGIGAGSLYHYFGGKEDLLIAICDQLMDPLLDKAQEILAAEAPAAEQLRLLVRAWVGHVVDHRDHMLVFQQERHVVDHGEQWREVRDARKRFERVVHGVLETVHAAGAARLDDPRLSLSALLGMVNHTAQWYRPRGRLTVDAIADGYTRCVLRDG